MSFAGPKRYTPTPLKVENLPPIHAVIISHNHYDHLDTDTIEALEAHSQPLWLVPLANRDLVEGEGASAERVIELDWWEAREVKLPLKPPQEAQQTMRFALTPTRKLAEARSRAGLPPQAFSTLALGESVGLSPSPSADAVP